MRCAELGNAGICFSLVGQTIAFCRLSTPGRFRCPTDHKKRWSVPPWTAAAYLSEADTPIGSRLLHRQNRRLAHAAGGCREGGHARKAGGYGEHRRTLPLRDGGEVRRRRRGQQGTA